MVYLIESVNKGQEPVVVQTLVDFAWDALQIRVAPHDQGLLVNFGEPLLDGALGRLTKRLGKPVRPVVAELCHVKWQVVCTYASPED